MFRSLRSRLRLGLVVGVVPALVLAASPAGATENFPGVIAGKLAAPEPPCTICHTSLAGGRGTVTKPFGVSMRARGLVPYDEASLTKAIDALAAEGKDSDGDGTGDIAELKAGGDPNAGGAGDSIVPEYGCSTTGGRGLDGSAILAAATIASILISRRRRR